MLTGATTFYRSFASFAGRRALVAAALVLAGAVLESIGILLIVPFLELYGGGAQSQIAATAGALMRALGLVSPQAQLLGALALFLLLLFLRGAIGWARDVRIMALTTGFVDHWRGQIFHALAGADWSKVTRYARSDIEHAITNDVVRLTQGTDRILRGGAGLVVLVTQLAIALVLSPLLTAFVLVFIAVATWQVVPLVGKARRLGEQLTRTGRGMHSVLGQFLSGLKLAKTHGAEQAFVARFDTSLAELRAQMLTFAREQAASQAVYQAILAVMVCAVIAVGALVFMTPVPVLTAILVILARLSGPFLGLLRGVQAFSYMMPAFEAVREVTADLAATSSGRARTDANGARMDPRAVIGPVIGPVIGAARVVMEDVRFAHPSQSENVLDGVSLTIEAGEMVALVGPSGAGKTTLVDVMVGLLAPTSGTVTIDGEPLAGAALQRWRRDLAYVPQDPFLFDLSLRENLLWVRPESTDGEIWQALAMAGADGFVRGLPDGLDSRAGERGQALSGGERQRICLARALLRRPRMLILDEATNAVDLELERRLLDALAGQRGHMTILVITHRLGSLEGAARVLELRRGRIEAADQGAQAGSRPAAGAPRSPA